LPESETLELSELKKKILDPLKVKTILCNFHSTKEVSVRKIGTIPNVVNNFFYTKKDVLISQLCFLVVETTNLNGSS
jgi:hypothetical protein